MAIALFALAIALSCAGCGTVSPSPIEGNSVAFDSSSPDGDQQTGGILKVVKDENGHTIGAMITEHERLRYNRLIEDYSIQHDQEYKTKLFPDDGLKKINGVWFMDAEHLEYLLRLSRWAREKRETDTWFMKAKEGLLP